MEAGWVVTEVGRQPWIVYNLMKVEDAATGNTGVWITFLVVAVLYVGARGHDRPHPAQHEQALPCPRTPSRRRRADVPYGPTGPSPTVGDRIESVTMSTAVAVVLFVAVTAYAVFGGADFGAGFWDLVAGGTARGERPRAVIDHSIGPVWEANHVWLIFCFVVLWTGFPEAYASITLTLFVPLTLAAFGIVLRGSSFAFRKAVFRTRDAAQLRRRVRPLVGARPVLHGRGRRRHRLRSGARRRSGRRSLDSWVNPTSVLGGVLAVVVVAYLAAVYLVWDARRLGDAAMVGLLPPAGRRRRRSSPASWRVVGDLRAAAPTPTTCSTGSRRGRSRSSSCRPPVASGRCVLLLRGAPMAPGWSPSEPSPASSLGWGVAQWPYMLPETLEVPTPRPRRARSPPSSSPPSSRSSSCCPASSCCTCSTRRACSPAKAPTDARASAGDDVAVVSRVHPIRMMSWCNRSATDEHDTRDRGSRWVACSR